MHACHLRILRLSSRGTAKLAANRFNRRRRLGSISSQTFVACSWRTRCRTVHASGWYRPCDVPARRSDGCSVDSGTRPPTIRLRSHLPPRLPFRQGWRSVGESKTVTVRTARNTQARDRTVKKAQLYVASRRPAIREGSRSLLLFQAAIPPSALALPCLSIRSDAPRLSRSRSR